MNTTLKRVISLMLCFVLMAGILPVGAMAAEGEETVATESTEATREATEPAASEELSEPEGDTAPSEEVAESTEEVTEPAGEEIASYGLTRAADYLDAAIFCSDVHGNPSTVTSIFNGIKSADSAFNPSTASFVGDTQCAASSVTSAAQEVYSSVQCIYAFGNHDDEGSYGINDFTGLSYGSSSTNYYIYIISENDMSTSSPDTSGFTSTVAGLDKTKPLFIISHMPLHSRRGDNKGAAAWYTAISAAAESMDIFFFWAHNHTSEGSADTAAYYVAKNGSETISIQGGSTVTPNFTYANAGYIDPPNTPARNNVATAVRIYTDSVNLTVYNASGELSGTYAVNETVPREFASAEVTLSSIAISGDTEYFVGDKLDLTVTANYSDGTTKDVTADATLSGYNMSTAGTQTVTATYEGKTATKEITVTAVQINSIKITTPATKLTYITGEELDTTGLVITAAYNNGTEAVVEGWYTSAVDMTTAGTKEVTVNYVVDGITYTTTYTITVEEGVAEGVTLTSIEITKDPDKTEYLLSQELALDGMVVVATFSDGSTKEIAYKPFSTSTVYGGYELYNFSMYVEKAHELAVVYTFGDVTCYDTTTINVWNEDFTDDNTGVKVHVADADYGVTAVNVTPSANSYVTSAMKNIMKDGTLTAYDITLTLDADGYALTNGAKTVTLPIPEGVTNPVVYYVSDDGATVTNMNATNNGDGTVTFTTTHFSTYVVGESAEIVVPDPENATGSGSTTTTEKKTIYKLVSSLTAGEEYLIVSSNSAGSAYGLAGSTTGASVTIKAADDVSSVVYIEDKGNALEWTASSGWKFASGDYDLGIASSGYGPQQSYSLSFSESDSWTLGTNTLYQSISGNQGGMGGGTNNRRYYLRCNNGTWSASTTSSNVYFYQKTEVDVETTTTISGTYSIAGEDVKLVVTEGSTTALKSTLTFTPTSGTATTTDTSATATYTVVEGGDPNGVISGISGNTVTFTGNTGKALVKVSYEVSFGEEKKTVTNYITIEASEPYYSLDLHKQSADADGNPVAGEEITAPVAIKGIKAGDTYSVWAVIKYYDGEVDENGEDGEDIGPLENPNDIEWNSSDPSVATVDPVTGIITFTGKQGTVNITATYKNGNQPYDTITISASPNQYSIPEDGTSDFPEYPNEGAIRFDKTATAVGNFSETGIAQVELSMTGVPYTKGSEIDVVVMLDMSTSMDDDRIAATVAATKVFVESIVKNEDGTYNDNRIYVGYFNGDTVYTITDSGNIGGELATVDNDTEYNALIAAIEDEYNGALTASGTNYDVSLEKCYNILTAAKTDGTGNNRDQFVLFMSDGGPTDYATSASNVVSESTVTTWFDVDDSDSSNWTNSVVEEYWSGLMKDNGVTIYSVGLILQEAPTSGPQDYRDYSADQNYYVTSTLLTGIASGADFFINCESATDTADMEAVFADIAMKILQAATDVTVEDKITDQYTMIFDIPEGSKDITGVTNDFYIEFGKCALDENHERTTFTSLTKVYLQNTNDVLSAKDATAPVFEAKTIGEKGTLYFWTTDAGYADKAAVSYNDGTTTYYFIPYGIKADDEGFDAAKWFNMTSGTYAYGTVDSETNMSEDLVIATPYFVYYASTRMIYWTVDKLDTEEYVLRYFLYLDNSATEVGTTNEVDPGSYQTNEYAYLTYTNFNGKECQQEFPIPQQTWSGAHVSYVFYLVNAAGQPINRSGQVVDFANAVFVTDVYTEQTVWNKGEDGQITADSQLSINWLAQTLLPSDYKVYDEAASYKLHVYGDHTGESIFDYFTISGNDAATISASLNSRLNLSTTASTVSVTTTRVYNTRAGQKITGYGTYTSEATDSIDNEVVLSNFDFYNTTVAFAVVWQPALVPDTVVVDYGLDVLINVVQNDILQNTVSGIGVGNSAYGNIAMNTGVSTEAKFGTAALTIEGNTISIESENQIRFHQGDMLFAEPVVFYYESPVKFYENSNAKEGYMYSSVTVIPATTVYYEDSFVDLEVYTDADDTLVWTDTEGDNYNDTTRVWTVEGSANNATQAQDRPGQSLISATLDADNNYGYDGAYANLSTYSMGSARKLTVDSTYFGKVKFSFCGTGFDVISMTSNATGTIVVQVFDASGNSVRSIMVDTFYGYTLQNGEWVVDVNNPNALYQVPVITVEGLDYGTYSVVITAAYNEFLDHAEDGSYDLYLDAIRIYDPTGNQNTTANNAYVADGEGWPSYTELRDNIISAEGVTTTTDDEGNITVDFPDDVTLQNGAIFIDSNDDATLIADYVSYGPNNELYLDNGQAVAFNVETTNVADVQLGIKSATGAAVTYTINGTTYTVSTATDMYYSILEQAQAQAGTVIIKNVSGGILSLTTIKVTYPTNPGDVNAANVLSIDEESAAFALMSLRRAPVVETEPTEPEVTEPTVPETETTAPETEETQPETETTAPETEETQPETEATQPETEDTQPETEETQPEVEPSEPEEDDSDVGSKVEETIRTIGKIIRKLLGWLFG